MRDIARVGDEIEVDARNLDQPVRRGKVLEVKGASDHPHYLVEWDDGHESVYFPSSDAHVTVRHSG